jgi:hypothetical protein
LFRIKRRQHNTLLQKAQPPSHLVSSSLPSWSVAWRMLSSSSKRSSSEAIKVVVLFALWSLLLSITKANEEHGTIEIIEAISSSSTQQANNNNTKTFSFDAVFSSKSSQKVVYDVCAAPTDFNFVLSNASLTDTPLVLFIDAHYGREAKSD